MADTVDGAVVEGVPGKVYRRVVLAYVGLVIAHALVLASDSDARMFISYVIVCLVQWLTIGAVIWRRNHSAFPNSFRWLLLAVALGFVNISNLLDLSQLIGGNYTPVPGASLFCDAIYVVMVVLSCATTFRRSTLRITTLIDVLMGAALAYLFFVQIFSVVGIEGSTNPDDISFIVCMFDVLGIYMTLIAGVRLLGSESVPRRHFFFVLFFFLLTSTALAAVRNHLLIAYGGQYLEILLLPSFLVLGLFCLRPLPVWIVRRNPRLPMVHVSESLGPLFLGLGLLGVSISIWKDHPTLGMLGVCMAVVGYGLRNVVTQAAQMATERSLILLQGELQSLTITDSLTGIANRRAFDELFRREFSAAEREQCALSLLMIDIDRFKEYNDLYGHAKGDECLRTVARLLVHTLRRPSDFIGRYGGEEFVALLPRTQIEGAHTVARRMNMSIEGAALKHEKGLNGFVTVSIGVATMEGGEVSGQEFMQKADQNLYRAKADGRNRYV